MFYHHERHFDCHYRRRGPGHSIMPVRGLLHLAILKIVKEGPTYGSEIQRILKERFSIDVPRAIIYSLLQRLEGHGLLVSTWDTSGRGPARRVYRITEEGEDYLKDALEKLSQVRDMIDRLTSS